MAKSKKDLLADAKQAREEGRPLPAGVTFRSYVYPHWFLSKPDGTLVPFDDDEDDEKKTAKTSKAES